MAPIGQGDFRTGNRLDPGGFRGPGKLHRTVEPVMIGHGQCLVVKLDGPIDHLLRQRRAVEERKGSMKMEFHVAAWLHGSLSTDCFPTGMKKPGHEWPDGEDLLSSCYLLYVSRLRPWLFPGQ